MGIAKRAAEQIDFDLTGKRRFHKLFRDFEYSNELPLKPEGGERHYSEKIPVIERKGNFNEISKGFNIEQAIMEASRCLRCDVRVSVKREED